MGEALGVAFGLMLICCSIICAYIWVIGPEREARRLEADWQREERHRWYRCYRARWRKNKRKHKPS